MIKRTVYISGKITGMEEEAKVLFANAAKGLNLLGYKTLNPFDLDDDHDKSWESYMKVCLEALRDCQVIYMLPNWRESKGAIEELKLAQDLGLNIIHADELIK